MILTPQIEHYAPQDLPVFITGEIGTGKSCAAHRLHSLSLRKHGPFLTILSRDDSPSKALECEIFGFEEPPPHSAQGQQPGKLELANAGTLVLDNLDEMPLGLQKRLARFLKNQSFQRANGKKNNDHNVRIIGTSRQDPQGLLASQRLHPQLYMQLHQLHIHLPPLADRKDLIEEMSHTFLSTLSKQMHKKILGFSPEVQSFLKSYTWPGNLRQLHNILERAVILEESKKIQITSLFIPEMKTM